MCALLVIYRLVTWFMAHGIMLICLSGHTKSGRLEGCSLDAINGMWHVVGRDEVQELRMPWWIGVTVPKEKYG